MAAREERDETVLIHGAKWRVADLEDAVTNCRASAWAKARWHPRSALRDRSSGATTVYEGQPYDPEQVELVSDGWDHDHCQVCWWTLSESADPAESAGYTNGHDWICAECFERFVAK